MTDVQVMAVEAALKKMVADGYFNICVIDKILKMTGGIPNREDYDVLSMLHCVHYCDMAPELLRGLPLIVSRVINSEKLTLELNKDARTLVVLRGGLND